MRRVGQGGASFVIYSKEHKIDNYLNSSNFNAILRTTLVKLNNIPNQN